MEDAVKLAAQYGIGGILALVLGAVVYWIGKRMVASIDLLPSKWEATSTRIIDRIDGHTKEDIAALAMLVNRVDVLQKTVDSQSRTIEALRDDVQDVLDRTPPPGSVATIPLARRAIPVGSQPLPVSGEYSIQDLEGRRKK